MNGTGPAAYRVLLGRELKALRDSAGLDREAVAQETGWHVSKVSRMESGQITLKVAEVDQLLALFNADDAAAERAREAGLHARKRGSYGKVPDWSRQFLGLEQDATELSLHQGELIPGLFQTEDYARRLIATSVMVAPADVDKVVEARMRRRALLERADPPRVHLVLGEAALHRQVGGPKVLAEQLDYLATVARLPHVTMQVLPFSSGEHAALGLGFTLLTLDIGGRTQWVYLEDLTRADCLPDANHVLAYRMTFDSLAINALGERETIATLEQSRDALAGG
jgi:transcriptional regulator with XRE-family HTH domain